MLTAIDYQNLFNASTLTPLPSRIREINYVCKVALAHESIYRAVQLATGIPWQAVACIHFRESGQDFTKHLHNGDPLTTRTTHVPAGRPLAGTPPFSWQDSAIDALAGVWKPIRYGKWSMPEILEFFERYNGLGYQKHGINTPYVWDYTSAYTFGLFVADGSIDLTVQEARPGCAAILMQMIANGTPLDFLA